MKKPHIQIHDSRRKKGEFFIRYVAANGEKLAHSETLSSMANVMKNLRATSDCFIGTSLVWNDCTKEQKFFKKYALPCYRYGRNTNEPMEGFEVKINIK